MALLLMVLFAALSPDDGRTLVLEACVQCHDMRAIESQKKSETEWRRTVNEMIWRGAPLMPGEVDLLVKYLARRAAVPAAVAGHPAQQLPPGRGRDLVMTACVGCHDLETTTSQRKTRNEWHRSVEQMTRLGAKLTGSEIRIVTDYLSRAFGK